MEYYSHWNNKSIYISQKEINMGEIQKLSNQNVNNDNAFSQKANNPQNTVFYWGIYWRLFEINGFIHNQQGWIPKGNN